MTQILPWLFLGSIDEAEDQKWLQEHGITHVLNTSKDIFLLSSASIDNDSNDEYIDIGDRKYFHAPFCDLDHNDNFDRYIQSAIEFICACRDEQGKILVHCYAGVNRSTTTVLFYLALHEDYKLIDAYAFVKAKRDCINPMLLRVIQSRFALTKQPSYYSSILDSPCKI